MTPNRRAWRRSTLFRTALAVGFVVVLPLVGGLLLDWRENVPETHEKIYETVIHHIFQNPDGMETLPKITLQIGNYRLDPPFLARLELDNDLAAGVFVEGAIVKLSLGKVVFLSDGSAALTATQSMRLGWRYAWATSKYSLVEKDGNWQVVDVTMVSAN